MPRLRRPLGRILIEQQAISDDQLMQALENPIRIHIERLDDTTRRITIEGVEL